MNKTIFTWKEDMDKEIETLRSRLSEAEKALASKDYSCPNIVSSGTSHHCKLAEDSVKRLEAENAKLGDELFKVREELEKAKGEQTWGCGHTNHGSCAQCLGHVTNERNDLLRKLAELRIQRDSYKTIAEEATKAGLAWLDELRLAREVVEQARRIVRFVELHHNTDEFDKALEAYDTALGKKEEE